MNFFKKYRRILAWFVIVVFILGGGVGILMSLGSIGSISGIPMIYSGTSYIDKSSSIQAKDYYQVYDEGEYYRLWAKYSYTKEADNYHYFYKFQLLDDNKVSAYEEELIPFQTYVTTYDNGILELVEYYEAEDVSFSIFYYPVSGAFSNMQYINTISEDGNKSYLIQYNENYYTIIPYEDSYAIVDIFDKEEFFKKFDFPDALEDKNAEVTKVQLVDENTLMIHYKNATGNIKEVVNLNSSNDDSSWYDQYIYHLDSNEPIVDETIYDEIQDNSTYDKVCEMLKTGGKEVFVTAYGSKVYGFLGENYEIYLQFSKNDILCGKMKRLREF